MPVNRRAEADVAWGGPFAEKRARLILKAHPEGECRVVGRPAVRSGYDRAVEQRKPDASTVAGMPERRVLAIRPVSSRIDESQNSQRSVCQVRCEMGEACSQFNVVLERRATRVSGTAMASQVRLSTQRVCSKEREGAEVVLDACPQRKGQLRTQ